MLEGCEKGPIRVGCEKCLTHVTDLRNKGGIMLPNCSLQYIHDMDQFFPQGNFSCLSMPQKEMLRSWPQHVMRAALVLLCHALLLCVAEQPAVHFGLVDDAFIEETEVVPVAANIHLLMMVGHCRDHYAFLEVRKPRDLAHHYRTVTIWELLSQDSMPHLQQWCKHIGAIFQRHWLELMPEQGVDDSGCVRTRHQSRHNLIKELPHRWAVIAKVPCMQYDGHSCGLIVLNRLAHLLKLKWGFKEDPGMEDDTSRPPEARPV